jgi:hypothetical protein
VGLDAAGEIGQGRAPVRSGSDNGSAARAPLCVHAGVFLISFGAIVLELSLTRLFSATMSYHFAFLAISLALFGSAAGGVLLFALGSAAQRAPAARLLSLAALPFAPAAVMALVVVLLMPLVPGEPAARLGLRLSAIYFAAALPFGCAGFALAAAFSRFAAGAPRLYACDLAGAAAGCVALIPLLDRLGAANTVLAVAAIGALSALLFSCGDPSGRPSWPIGALAVAGTAGLLGWNVISGRIDVRVAKGLSEAGNVIFSRWNSFSRVTVWGSLEEPSVLALIDADAATVITREGGHSHLHEYLRDSVEALAYHVRPKAKVLIIGAGGGNDVIAARLHGATSVTAVEVNPLIAREIVLAEPFKSYSADLFERPGVRLVVDEARSFIRRSPERYDVILGTMVDTWAATAAGAFSLTENSLYTVEAFRDYEEHLAAGGVLSLTRWHLAPPDQLLRLVALARAALREEGIADASRRLMLVRGRPDPSGQRAAATFLMKRGEFGEDEVRAVEAVAARAGFQLLYTPATRPPGTLTRLVVAEDPEAVWASYPNLVSPTRDDSPFFFHSVRLGRVFEALTAPAEARKTNLGTLVLVVLLALSVAVTVLLLVGPLVLTRRRAFSEDRGRRLALALYFSCLGAGFMLVELALIQKLVLFLGPPVYALAVVLSSLLLAGALGSALSARIGGSGSARRPAIPVLVLAAMVVAYVELLPILLGSLLHLERPARIAVAVGLLLPLGTLMGFPMPTGIRIAGARAPEIVPWGWGLNGAASVLGSVGATAIALFAGFSAALLTGAGAYFAAGVLLAFALRSPSPAPAAAA